jgi:FKBP-type peptidyl-prolyl cis-trans isomerase
MIKSITMNKITTFLLAFAFIMTISSCNKDSEDVFDEQVIEIQQYMTDEGLTGIEVEGSEGLYYTITTAGTGVDYPTEDSEVTVHYVGRLLDGTKFDSSYDRGQPFTSALSSVISGWRIGIPKFRKGDVGKLIIPSKYGYGSSSTGTIPGNSVLVFDIELIDFD